MISCWERRMELKIILSFFQIILAMFLPLILMGLKIQGTQIRVDLKQAAAVFISLLCVVGLGFCFQVRKQGGFAA